MTGVRRQAPLRSGIKLGSAEKLPIADKSIDLVVTSPPYKDKDGYTSRMMKRARNELSRVVKPDSLIFINFGQLAEDPARPWKVASLFCKSFKLVQTFCWLKAAALDPEPTRGQALPINSEKRVNGYWEPVFMFATGPDYKLDRLAIGVPYADKSNEKRWKSGSDVRCRGDVWWAPHPTTQSKDDKHHPHQFPEQLAEFAIRLSNVPKDSIVLDPFSGGGTTAVVAKRLGMRYIGVDIDGENVRKSRNRVKRGQG